MDLSFTNSTPHVIYRTDIDHDGVHKEPLSSSRFWKRFAEMKIDGYSRYIKYFEPRLKEFEDELQTFKDPTGKLLGEHVQYILPQGTSFDPSPTFCYRTRYLAEVYTEHAHRIVYLLAQEEQSWAKSIKAQLDQEKAQLELFKAYRTTFGSMIVELRALESKHQNDDTALYKMKSDLKQLEEDCKRINKKLAEEKAELEGKLIKLENLILISSPLVQQKADKVSKMAVTYDKLREEREEKISSILKKSDDIFQTYERVENERTNNLLKQWKDALSNTEKNFKAFRRAVQANKGVYKCDGIDVLAMTEMTKRKRQRILRMQEYQTSGELIKKSVSCVDFFHERDEHNVVSSLQKDGFQRKVISSAAMDDSIESETEVKPFDVEEDTEKTRGPTKRYTKHKSCWDEKDSADTKTTEFSQPRPLPQPKMSAKSKTEADEPLQNEQNVLPTPTTVLPYVVKIKAPFQKEVDGQISVRKGDKVKVFKIQ